jgi:hypothetical protein
MKLTTQLGLNPEDASSNLDEAATAEYIRLKLLAMGVSLADADESSFLYGMGRSLLASYQERTRLLSDYLPPCDQRIQDFLERYFKSTGVVPKLPRHPFTLDRHGVGRVLSLPCNGDHFSSEIIDSYRIRQGVLHNPKSDRRTTKGVFHVTEDGLPIPNDKKAVPRLAAARLLEIALKPPAEAMRLPFTAYTETPVESWVSLLMRPVVVPQVKGFTPEKSYEVRFFAPGSMVCNLDFVESIFGNGGDPSLPENDAALDPEHWTGHSGCVILAPHMLKATKKELGLPHYDSATDRQRHDGMCWRDENEIYNDGGAFKITCRDASGVVVTAIADNYFGYCKKEVKTQISFSANLFGLAEEEHAGGTMCFTGADLGEDFQLSRFGNPLEHRFEEMHALYNEHMDLQAEGYAIDRNYQDIIYIPEDARISLNEQKISWVKDGMKAGLKLLPERTYVYPSGYKVAMIQPAEGRRWRLAGFNADAIVLHKPCTVSGGGKSEISKPISDAIVTGPVFVNDFQADFELAENIINRNYSDRFRDHPNETSRPILNPERSLGSVVKLLTPSATDYNDAYNEWLQSIPQHVKELVFIIKRFYKEDWGNDWRKRFSVDSINGIPGKELRYRGLKLLTQYLRVGYAANGSWRTFGLRKDFLPSQKFSTEDDITASVVVPIAALDFLPSNVNGKAAKFIHNCEYRFFQRPDDAIIRGYDKVTESDMSQPGNFLSNYEPLPKAHAIEELEDTIRFSHYTAPMQAMIRSIAAGNGPDYYCTNAFPRLVNGKPTENPRYQQVRPDIRDPRGLYLAEQTSRMRRRAPLEQALYRPVSAVLPGRRNNPPDPAAGIGALCVYNPIHYYELPELFMEYIASITGKSPSTTGAGSEGALTKAPFNALPPIYDLNNALVAYICSGHPVFITSAGYVGPNYRVDHDISLLVPELWARLRPSETDPDFLIKNGFLEKVVDFEYKGERLLASRLGYRITSRFMRIFGGRIFSNPTSVFPEEMLKPELQDPDIYASGIKTITAAHKEVAENYFADGSIELACPPLYALLHIMAKGDFKGMDSQHPDIRKLFTLDVMLESDWYQQRLVSLQQQQVKNLKRGIQDLEAFKNRDSHQELFKQMDVHARLSRLTAALEKTQSADYLQSLQYSLGRQPIE